MKSYLMITGARGGLGSAFVLEAARRGFDLFLTDLSADGDALSRQISEQFQINVIYRPCDLADDNARESFLGGLKTEGFTFWGLINVAGLDHEGMFLEKSRSQILKILKVNVLSTTDVTHEILQLRDPEKKFRLITVCSLAGFYPMPYKATYAASKRFLLDMSRALREEIKDFGSVTALCPAGMPTTVECMRSIFAQGFWGMATSMNMDVVARLTLKAALKGRGLVIPGFLNQMIHALSSLVPAELALKYVAKRGCKARAVVANSLILRETPVEPDRVSMARAA